MYNRNLMRIVHGLRFFYQKLIIPSLVLSVLLAYFVLGLGKLCSGTGISFIFLTPVFHYFTYELRRPNEYYFYYNLGLSKSVLWLSTIGISLVIGLVLYIL